MTAVDRVTYKRIREHERAKQAAHRAQSDMNFRASVYSVLRIMVAAALIAVGIQLLNRLGVVVEFLHRFT